METTPPPPCGLALAEHVDAEAVACGRTKVSYCTTSHTALHTAPRLMTDLPRASSPVGVYTEPAPSLVQWWLRPMMLVT